MRKERPHLRNILQRIVYCLQWREQKCFIRFRSLGEDFTEENLKKVIAGEKEPPERNEKMPERKEAKPEKRKFDLVVDIQKKNGTGKERRICPVGEKI